MGPSDGKKAEGSMVDSWSVRDCWELSEMRSQWKSVLIILTSMAGVEGVSTHIHRKTTGSKESASCVLSFYRGTFSYPLSGSP